MIIIIILNYTGKKKRNLKLIHKRDFDAFNGQQHNHNDIQQTLFCKQSSTMGKRKLSRWKIVRLKWYACRWDNINGISCMVVYNDKF